MVYPFIPKQTQTFFSDLIRTALPKSLSPTKVVLLIAELMLAVKSDVMLVTKDWSWRVFRRITGLHEVSRGSKEVLPSHSWVSQSVGNKSPISSSKLGVLSPKNVGLTTRLFLTATNKYFCVVLVAQFTGLSKLLYSYLS